jgi:hypothetical protein
MQIKTIKKNISSKMEEWIGTIENESLKKSLKANILVSGGCIVSMLLNENVNDYDVYIKDRAVLLELVNYYANKFPSEVTVLDGSKKEEYVSQIESDYKGVHESIDSIHNAYAVSIRNLQPEQIKMFFNRQVGFKPDYEEKDEKPYRVAYLSPNAISLSDNLQIVIRFWGDNEQIHKSFDFIHATNYFTFQSGLVTNKEALESIITKQLKYQGSLYPLTSIIRARKFIKRGWNIGAGELLKIMWQISELNLKNIDVLSEQLIGVDVAYFEKIVNILRDVPEDKLTSPYINEIIDRVFDSEEEIDN